MEHSYNDCGVSTKAIHVGYDSSEFKGALNVPIFMTSTFDFENFDEAVKGAQGISGHPIYNRIGCPTNDVLEAKIAALECGEAGASFASGMGAISSVVWSTVKKGDHALVSSTVYGCTLKMFNHFKHFGVDVELMSFTDPKSVQEHMKPNTTLVYFETPANPTNDIIDIQSISNLAHSYNSNCTVVVDNTFSTPIITRPLTLGADIVLHSATKYLSGHGDLIAGLVVSSKERIAKIKSVGVKDMTGAVLDPFQAHLLIRGIKTLECRMKYHSKNATKLVEYLSKHPKITHVYCPWLTDNKYHDIAVKQMSMPHAVICFEAKGNRQDAARFMNSLKLCKIAVSLGDCETLFEHPATMTHSPLSAEELKAAGISETLIRVSVGLEDIEDIIADVEQALDKL